MKRARRRKGKTLRSFITMTSKEFGLLMLCAVLYAAAAVLSNPRNCRGYEPLHWMDEDDECHSNRWRRRQFAKEQCTVL